MQLTELIASYLPKIFKSRIAQEGDQDSPVDSSTDTTIPSIIAGFTPIFSNPRASGGKSVSRRDMNGFLRVLSEEPYFMQLLGQTPWRREIAGITVASTAEGTGPVQEFTPGCGWELDTNNQTFEGYPRCAQVFCGGYSWESKCDNNHCEPGNTLHKQEYVNQNGVTVTGTNPWKLMNFDDLPIASRTKLGAIKVGNNLFISADGTLNAIGGGGGGGTGGSTDNPVGTIIAYIGADTPEGYLLCDGREVSKNTYSNLYSVIGDKFGEASSSANFKLPDLGKRYLQGTVTADEEGQYISEALPLPVIDSSSTSHSHNAKQYIGGGGGFLQGGVDYGYGPNYSSDHGVKEESVNVQILSTSVYKDGANVTPESLTVRYCIKYTPENIHVEYPNYAAEPVAVTNGWVATESGYVMVPNSDDTGFTSIFPISQGDALNLVGSVNAKFIPAQSTITAAYDELWEFTLEDGTTYSKTVLVK